MAEFTLATSRLPQGQVGSLKANPITPLAGTGGIRAGQINPNAGAVAYAAAPIPKTVENMLAKGTQHLMEVTAKSAFAYQERQADYTANETALRFSEKSRKGLRGYTDEQGNYIPGYMSSRGNSANTLFDSYKAKVDKEMAESLEGLDSMTKQRALLRLQSIKNQTLSQAAQHRASEDRKAFEQQRYSTITEIASIAAEDPNYMFRKDTNGVTGVDQIRRMYIDPKSADKAVFGLAKEAVDMAYLSAYQKVLAIPGKEYAIEEAHIAGTMASEKFLTDGGNELLRGSIETRTDIAKDQKRRVEKMIETKNYLVRSQLAADEAALRVKQKERISFISAVEGTPEQVSESQLRDDVLNRRITETNYRIVTDGREGDDFKGVNVTEYKKAEDIIINGGYRNQEYLSIRELSKRDRENLDKLWSLVNETTRAPIHKEVMKNLESLIKVMDWGGEIDTVATGRVRNDRSAYLVNLILENPKMETIELTKLASIGLVEGNLSNTGLYTFPNNVRPALETTTEAGRAMLNGQMALLNAEYKKGNVTEAQFTYMKTVQKNYEAYFNEQDRLEIWRKSFGMGTK